MAGVAARVDIERWGPPSAVALGALVLGVLAGVSAVTSIAAALSLALLLVAFSDLTAGLMVFALLAYLEEVIVLGPVLSVAKIAGLVLVVSWIARVSTQRGSRGATFFGAHPGAAYLLLVFLGWAALSVTWSENTADALADVSRYALNLVLFVIVFSAVQSRRQAAWVFGALIAGTGVIALYGLVLRPTVSAPLQTRIVSTVGDPNVLAALLIAGLALSLGAVFACTRQPLLRLGALTVVPISVVALILTGSRGGAIALLVAGLAAIAVAGRWRGRAAAASVAVIAATVIMFVAYAPADVRERFTIPSAGEFQATESRNTIWQVGWRIVEDRPITGVGVGNFGDVAPRYTLEPGVTARSEHLIDRSQLAHNIYLQVLSELGVVGLVLFLTIVAFSVGAALVAARRFQRSGDLPMEIMARALIVAMVGYLAASFFLSEQFSKILWLLLALGPGVLAIARTQRDPDSGSEPYDDAAYRSS